MRTRLYIGTLLLVFFGTANANEPGCATPKNFGGLTTLTLTNPISVSIFDDDPVVDNREEIAEEFQQLYGNRVASDAGPPGIYINFSFKVSVAPVVTKQLIIPNYKGQTSLEKAILDLLTPADSNGVKDSGDDPSPCDPSLNGFTDQLGNIFDETYNYDWYGFGYGGSSYWGIPVTYSSGGYLGSSGGATVTVGPTYGGIAVDDDRFDIPEAEATGF